MEPNKQAKLDFSIFDYICIRIAKIKASLES